MANRLGAQASSYLKSAAHQPVHWEPWGADAFERARREDKPILLDVGAVWCHWCHVMDRESYEDPAIAEILNERFVAVKVDRDERPDVDARYQKAIQAMTGQGGWPLTAFLLPDGRVFYGGTYYPPRDAHGRPSFRRVLLGVSDAFRERREEALANATSLAEHLSRPAGASSPLAPSAWDDALAHAVGHMRDEFDAANGGFGRAPKFPHAAAHDFLLERGLQGDGAAKDMLVATLVAMQEGGIHDQLGGGFHRYSVDAEWIVPHFEKMLYDNAGLLRNYARAAGALGRADFAATASDVVGFLRDVLRQPSGAFGGSQDADINLDDDGDYFTWTLEELAAAIPDKALAHQVALHYGIRSRGDMHHDPARCVLRIETPEDETLRAAKEPMRQARAKRQAPFVDPIRYTAWNGMTIGALFEAGEDALAAAALDATLRDAWDDARGFHRTPGGPTGILDDNAQMLDALLEAHFATGQREHLDLARRVADLILAEFRHPQGGFADRAPRLAPPAEAASLAAPERPIQDAPTASANGVALRALLRLAEATGEERYHDEAIAALEALARDATRLSLFGGALLLAMDAVARPPPRIVVPRGDAAAFRAVARRDAKPGATFAGAHDPMPEEARAYQGQGALVCMGTRCLAPCETPEALGETLRALRAGRA